MTTLYIAGPMTGLPEFNYPAFLAAEDRLLAAGHAVANPARIDERNLLFPKSQRTWDWYMRHALRMLLGADGVAILPGWQDSKGARLERQVALQLGMDVRPVGQWLPVAP